MNVKNLTKIILIIVLGCGFLVFTGCSTKTETALTTEPQSAFSLQEYQELISQGDGYFSAMHLYGWLKAEEFYNKAYTLHPTQELKEKRLLNLCLIALREKQEKIVDPTVFETMDTLGNIAGNRKLEYLLEIVRHYRTLPVIRQDNQRIAAKEKKEVDATLFDLANSPLDTYLYLVCLNYFSYDLKAYSEELNHLLNKYNVFELMDKYSLSPLFIYSNYKKVADREAEIENRFPEFAEYMIYKGDRLFSRNRLREASRYYRKVLELIPGYTRASNGLGNIYYFTINDYETALSYYQRTLDLDPTNPTALFGKGVSLHYLERYAESDQVLDFMLANQDQYHGQAYYYKAYNQYRLQNPEKARELIDHAKTLLQRSGEVFFLSGLLYYQQGNMKAAEQDFLSALYDHEYSPCYPLYYLGMTKIKSNDWSFLRDFSDSISCFEKTIANMNNRLLGIDALDLEDFQKEWMKRNQAAQLQAFKESSAQMIQQMNAFIAQNIEKKNAFDRQRQDEALVNVKALVLKDPDCIDRPNPKNDGGTLLHEAVQNNRIEVVKYLLSQGARMDVKDNTGYTPLHWAVMLGSADITRCFIDNGADITQTGANNMTLLHDAAYNGNKEIVSILLDKGADLDAKDQMGSTPLDLAIEKGHKEVLSLLKPLHIAVEKGDLPAFRQTLEKLPHQLETRDELGRTPLHLAAMLGNTDIAWELLNRGANIEARDTDGFTPKELAEQKGLAQMAQLLLGRGAQPGNHEFLAKALPEKHAILWYLGGQGWAVKTQNHFLIFDYQPIPVQLGRLPLKPFLANGQINADELEDQRIYVFLSKEILDTGSKGIVSLLGQSPRPVTYISNNFARKTSQFISIQHHEARRMDGIDIVGFKSPGETERMGYLLQVDGLVIFYPGNQGYWTPTVWEEFRQEIDYLRNNGNEGTAIPGIDIAFLPLQGNFGQVEPQKDIEKGLSEIVRQLYPALLIPVTPEGEEYRAVQFKEEIEKTLPVNPRISCPARRGDRFFYPVDKAD